MTPRRPDDGPEFEEQFDDDVFASKAGRREDADGFAAPEPKAKRRAAPRRRAPKPTGAPPPTRARRILHVAGASALAALLLLFVISFISGLGGPPEERVVGDAERGGERLDRIGPRVRVEVLNAGGVAGLARRATEHLRDRGFDVVAFGNAGVSGQEATVVVGRTADTDDARAVAAALGVDSVIVEPDAQLYLDVTVLLGSDWPAATEIAAPDDPGFLGWFRRLFD